MNSAISFVFFLAFPLRLMFFSAVPCHNRKYENFIALFISFSFLPVLTVPTHLCGVWHEWEETCYAIFEFMNYVTRNTAQRHHSKQGNVRILHVRDPNEQTAECFRWKYVIAHVVFGKIQLSLKKKKVIFMIRLHPNDERKMNAEINQVVIIDEQKNCWTLNLLSFSFHFESCHGLAFWLLLHCVRLLVAQTTKEIRTERSLSYAIMCNEPPEKNWSNEQLNHCKFFTWKSRTD